MYENFQQTIERAQNYPLYSQDGNGKFAKCISILHIGNIRWYILEGQKEGDDFIMFGKESAGIPEEILVEHEETCIRIPMLPTIRSLNLSNSVAIAAYEALRQQGFPNLL